MIRWLLTIFTLSLFSCSSKGGDTSENEKNYANVIKASITIKNLSRKVTLNNEATIGPLYEYKWSVRFDTNDDGLFGPPLVFLWKIKSVYYPEGLQLAGMGLVTGIDEEGETVPPTMSIEDLNDSLTFHQHPLIRKDMA